MKNNREHRSTPIRAVLKLTFSIILKREPFCYRLYSHFSKYVAYLIVLCLLLINFVSIAFAQSMLGPSDAQKSLYSQGVGEIQTQLARGVGINDPIDNRGNTYLHIIMTQYIGAYKARDMAEFLLRNGANPNARNIDGNTPLHHAFSLCLYSLPMSNPRIMNDWVEVARTLIRNGADSEAKNALGLTPRQQVGTRVQDGQGRLVEMRIPDEGFKAWYLVYGDSFVDYLIDPQVRKAVGNDPAAIDGIRDNLRKKYINAETIAILEGIERREKQRADSTGKGDHNGKVIEMLVPVNVPSLGDSFTIPDLGTVLMRVERGSFRMGTEIGRNENERPVRTVEITQDFWMGKYEVTQGEYETIMGTWPSSRFRGRRLPVDNMLWESAVEYCEKLTERERTAGRLPKGYVYRLPTEAEWEYAARGGNKSRSYLYSGGNDVKAVAWHRGNSDDRTHEVGLKEANELGLHDMNGNVVEWVHDWYQSSYSGLATRNPTGPASGSYRVYRGGHFDDFYWRASVTARGGGRGVPPHGYRGFRVVLAPAFR